MTVSRKKELMPMAEILRAEGRTYDEIAEQIGIASKTVARWFQIEQARRNRPLTQRLSEQLEARLEKLFEDEESKDEQKHDPKFADRALKLCKLIEALRAGPDEISASLIAIMRFIRFCLITLTEEEMQPIRRAVALFIDDLKQENS